MISSALSLLVLASWTVCEKLQVNKSITWRLPSMIQPLSYRLHINVTDAALTEASNEYSGFINISLKTTKPTQILQLHASYQYLKLNLITFAHIDLDAEQYFVDCTTDTLTMQLPFVFQPAANASLIIDFTGYLSTKDLLGFYKTSYVTSDGKKKYMAMTKMKPTGARRAFPCFDEPSFKATFEINITYPVGYNALSNTPGTLYANDSTSETMSFEKTVVMSTYLVAFVISDFTCYEGESVNTVPIRVCSNIETSNCRNWALDVAPKILHSLNEYTQYGYDRSMVKIDLVAVPQFTSEAMENWGLVTSNEQLLIWDPDESTETDKREILLIIAHAFAHFWMGNLVTYNWWSEIFLNEGLAKYFEYLITRDIIPSWKLDKQYIVDTMQVVLQYDVRNGVLPLQSEVYTSTEAKAQFGIITYYKGSAIFNMIRYVVGSEKFKEGLRNYFQKYKYLNTAPQDLWTELQGVTDNATAKFPSSNLGEIMDNWIKKPGYPLLTLRTYDSSIEITQERFLISEKDKVTRWYVPVCYTTSANPEKFACKGPDFWLTPTKSISLKISKKSYKWLMINNHQGYFRVNYDTIGWNNLKNALQRPNFDGIVDISRSQIVDDLFSLAQSGKISFSRAFGISQFLENDTSYFPWVAAIRNFKLLMEKVVPESPMGQTMSKQFLNLMDNLYNSVSFINHKDDHIYTLKQVLVFQASCQFGKMDCIVLSYTLFLRNKMFGIKPNKNLRTTAYCYAMMRSEDKSDWEFLWKAYLNSTLDSERLEFINALGCSQNKELLEGYLNLAFAQDSGVKDEDRLPIFQAICVSSSIGVEVAFEFLKKNYERIKKMHGGRDILIKMIHMIASTSRSIEQLRKLKKFIESSLSEERLVSALPVLGSTIENMALLNKRLAAYYLKQSTDSAESLNRNICVVLLIILRCCIDF